MTIGILLLCVAMLSAVPVQPNVPPTSLSEGVTQTQRLQPAETTSPNPDAQTPAPLLPKVEQPQPGVSQQPGVPGDPQFLPPTPHFPWSPLGGSPMIITLQPSLLGSQPTLPQQPLFFSPYTYLPPVSSPYGNQLFAPYGFPMILASSLPQSPTNQALNSPVLPAETLSGAAAGGSAPQPMQQQQQNPQILYMLQQTMNSPLGSLSSEELEMAAQMGQLGVYLPGVLTNPSVGAVQPVNQAAGLTNPEQQGIVPTVGTSAAGIQQKQKPSSSGSLPTANGVPSGSKRPTQDAVTVQTPLDIQPTQGNL